jgi:hypothetical protein
LARLRPADSIPTGQLSAQARNLAVLRSHQPLLLAKLALLHADLLLLCTNLCLLLFNGLDQQCR